MSDAVDGRGRSGCEVPQHDSRLCGKTTLFYRSDPPSAHGCGTSAQASVRPGPAARRRPNRQN
eukprot:4646193-Prymnesium_polylepis.1